MEHVYTLCTSCIVWFHKSGASAAAWQNQARARFKNSIPGRIKIPMVQASTGEYRRVQAMVQEIASSLQLWP